VPLRIVAGLPGAGASAHAFNTAVAAASNGRSALLLVPSSRYAARLREVIAAGAPVGLRAAGIKGLVESEWTLKGDGRRLVNDLHREIVLSRALVAAGVSDHPGRGAVALLGTIATRSCAQGCEVGAEAAGLSGALLQALRGYLEALTAAHLVDEAEATRLLAHSAPPADLVAVEGLVSLTPDREALLAGWSAAGCDVLISLPWEPGCAATQPLDAMVRRLESAGAAVAEWTHGADARGAELARIARELFSGAAARPALGAVELGIARGDEAEERLIADRVTELLASGVPGERIAVAYAEPERHVGWLRRAFDDGRIDAAWDVRVPVPETPLGRSMLRLWSFSSGGMLREDLAAFMRSSFSGVAADVADRADVRWRSHRTSGGALVGSADRARPLVNLCTRISRQPIDASTAKEWKQLADRLLANAYGHDAPVPGMDGALDAAVHRAFCQALAAVAESGDRSMSASDLWAAFESASVSPASQDAPGRVTVTSMDGLRGRTFDAVIIGGLTGGEAPRRGSDDRLEGDAVRGALGALGIVSDSGEQARLERLSFYLAATAAAGSLTLVRRETDDDGRALRPSVFWEEFLDLYRETGSAIEECEGLPATRRRVLLDAGADGVCPPRGELADPAVLALLATIGAVSPGEVELYTGCPYRWFIERRLRPRGPDAEVDVMVAGLASHKALAAFYREWTAGGYGPRVTSDRMPEALELARAAIDRALAESPAPSTLDEEWLLASVEPAVLALVERDARFLPDYAPTWFEWSFGLEEGDEPIDLGGVSIRGRADRIDIGSQGIMVIDYKRSKAKSLAEIEREGLVQLQLYAAAASVRLGLPVAGGVYRSLSTGADRGFISDSVVGAFFDSDVRGPSDIAAVLEQAVETARAAVAGMRRGAIAPSPDPKRCPYCSALGFCPEGARS
jgi:RecB family exonuclease